MRIRKDTALSFDDVLLVPQHYSGTSRSEVSLKTSIAGLQLDLPIVSANMPSVTSIRLARVLADRGGLPIFDRMGSVEEQMQKLDRVDVANAKFGASVGIGPTCLEDARELIKYGASLICVDVAHADQRKVFEVYESFRSKWPKFPLIVGNFATPAWVAGGRDRFSSMFLNDEFLAVKMGVGGGSVCTTRVMTGCGLPTLQSVLDARNVSPAGGIIADGGLRNSGDIVKALAAGADAVMLGSLLAGTDESPGEVLHDAKTGSKYKTYRGNASAGVKQEAGLPSEHIEGIETLIPYVGPVSGVLNKLEDGIRSGFTYCGAQNLQALMQTAEFTTVTVAGYREGLPHRLL